jgi:multicomponent Na+:H+ antiporter subunit A
MGVLEEGGAIAKRMTQSLVEISQLSAANLSNSIIYEVFLGVIIFWLLLAALFTMVQWRSAKNMPVVAHAFVSAAMMSGMLYLLARLYPAIHDNPLWWTIVTGIGLLIMLLGALWALRQSDPKAILIYRSMSAFGACIALLGLPEFLGYKVALIGIVVHTLSHAALFLNLDNTYKQSRLIIVALATLPLAIFYVLMIEAFYRVTLAWSGIALAVVVVSIALWVISAIRIIREALSQPDSVGAQRAAPSLWIIPGLLAFASILCILLFDPLFAPLLNPMITRPPFESYLATSIGLGILAAVGGAILYTTRETWSRFIPTSPVPQIDNLPEH